MRSKLNFVILTIKFYFKTHNTDNNHIYIILHIRVTEKWEKILINPINCAFALKSNNLFKTRRWHIDIKYLHYIFCLRLIIYQSVEAPNFNNELYFAIFKSHHLFKITKWDWLLKHSSLLHFGRYPLSSGPN